MKRFLASLMALVMVVCMAAPALAAEPEQTVIDLGVEYLENGVTCHTTLVIEQSLTRATKGGYLRQDYSIDEKWIGSIQLNGIFEYDGKTARATQVSVYHSTASGWSYSGENAWCSGNSVNMTAQFMWWGNRVPISAKLSCSPTGVLS